MIVVEFHLCQCGTVNRAYPATSVSKSASTASGASALDDKKETVQYKPTSSLAGNNNALAQYEQSRGYDQISHALSNIHGLYGWSCNLLDVTSVYSLNPGSCQAISPTNGLGTRLWV